MIEMKLEALPHGFYMVLETIVSPTYHPIGNKIIVSGGIPKGFVTDLASVPAPLHWLFNPLDKRTIFAAALHDYHYATHMRSRKDSDRLFYRILVSEGFPKWRAKLAYWAVRLFGAKAYAKTNGMTPAKYRVYLQTQRS